MRDLYARDSKGRVKIWKSEVKHDLDLGHGVIITQDGLADGKLVRRVTRIKEGKNLGKANATTPYVQACNELKSKWENKRLKGYKCLLDLDILTIPDNKEDLLFVIDNTLPKYNTDKSGVLQPMKAQQYYKTASDGTKSPRIKFPCLGQPKINGVRCFAIYENGKIILKSKNGLVYKCLEHIEQELEKVFIYVTSTYDKHIILDGELYIHDFILSDIKSAVTKRNMYTPMVTFDVFDIAIDNITQKSRSLLLNKLYNEIITTLNSVKYVEDVPVDSDKKAQELTDIWIKAGFEGGIFRDLKAMYKFGGRPMTMVKLKRKESAEFEVLNVLPMKKTPHLGMFLCKNDLNDFTFTVVAEGTHEQKQEYLDNKLNYIGKQLSVDFYERTKAPKELPFHAVGITIRDYE